MKMENTGIVARLRAERQLIELLDDDEADLHLTVTRSSGKTRLRLALNGQQHCGTGDDLAGAWVALTNDYASMSDQVD